ncbi:NDP-hexose 2,3-dehydratase family protein [Streptomyces sp. NPDC005955]|uniref:NDP-hexose 2,3-dehydratase family protein n=1 Tax=Streptomyces sp. NPDC005955 TaxID=3364738 RepID=UPI0036C9E2EB
MRSGGSPALRSRAGSEPEARLARSAADRTGRHLRTEDVVHWLAARYESHAFQVEGVPLDELNGWHFEADTGNLVHESGRFFSIVGISASVSHAEIPAWQQPIIRQQEVGILGLLVKEFDGVPHFLMQAKMEPGNPNLIQLSPTVQATRSNFEQVHRGSSVSYLEHFVHPEHVIADSLQSEHGSWFHQKFNRNMVVETHADVPLHDDFCWLTLGQIGRLLRLPNVVNMDARSIISCLPLVPDGGSALHTDLEVTSWLVGERARHSTEVRLIGLDEVDGWHREAEAVARPDGRYFRVRGVTVRAGSREVPSWSQPLLEPSGVGVAAFVFRRMDGVPHLLVQAKVEAGFRNVVEMAPTVQCTPENWTGRARIGRPRFLDYVVASADAGAADYDVVQSEEGGRFLNAEIRYIFVQAGGDESAGDPPSGFRWLSVEQLRHMTAGGHVVNVQARTLLSLVNSGAVVL